MRDGYYQATLAEIADAAGYTTGAVFASFDGKADLFLAVLDRWLELRLHEVAGWLDVPEPERMAGTVREWFAKLEAEPGWLVVLLEFRLAAARDPELNEAYKLRNDRFLDATVAVIQATREGLGLEPAPAARELAVAAAALGYGLTLERLTDPEGVSTEQASLAEVLLGEAYGRSFARERARR
jgi:AcrR family transcriptional regulator